jgi:hypothetical protein
VEDLDRSLGSEPALAAPAALHAAVMRAVQREGVRPAPIAFPWLRFSVGLAAGVLVCTLVVLHAPAIAARL